MKSVAEKRKRNTGRKKISASLSTGKLSRRVFYKKNEQESGPLVTYHVEQPPSDTPEDKAGNWIPWF